MAKRRFNWKVAAVFVICIVVLAVTIISLRQWQRGRMAQTAYKQGLDAYENRLWEKAADNLGRYLATDAANIEILSKYAQCQLNIRPLIAGNIRQAAAAYRKILRTDKTNLRALEKLTGLYLQTNNAAEAELIARRYLQKNKSPEIRTMLAMAMAKQRKFKEASSQLTDVIKDYPNYVVAYEILARLTEQQPDDSGVGQPPGVVGDVADNCVVELVGAKVAAGHDGDRPQHVQEADNDEEPRPTHGKDSERSGVGLESAEVHV